MSYGNLNIPLLKKIVKKKNRKNDTKLVEQLKNSSHKAFEKLFFKYYQDVQKLSKQDKRFALKIINKSHKMIKHAR